MSKGKMTMFWFCLLLQHFNLHFYFSIFSFHIEASPASELQCQRIKNPAPRVQPENPRDWLLCDEPVTMNLSFESALHGRTSSSCIWKFAWASARMMYQWLIRDYSPDGASVNSYRWFGDIINTLSPLLAPHDWLLCTIQRGNFMDGSGQRRP